MKRVVFLISGNGSNLQAIIDKCKNGDIKANIVSVISNNPDAFGLERAKSENINTKVINHNEYKTRDLFDNDLFKYIEEVKPDLIVLAGFMRILTKKITDSYFGKIINIHPSLLPKYPGLNTHSKAIENRDSLHGVSVHYVSTELDAGPLIAQATIKTKEHEKIDELVKRIHKIEHKIFPKVIKLICNDQISLDSGKVVFHDIKINGDYIDEYFEI
jgi:phosphoribosylglycinamide formyltransferase-1|tara:strand:+ start:9785 stop:10432 length:648 start_codon:yes stop_codon:yes gene_type:complete